MRPYLLILGMVGMGLLAWKLFPLLHPDDRTRIQRRIHQLEASMSYEGGSGNFAHARAADKIRSLFTADAKVELQGTRSQWQLSGRGEIQSAVLQARRRYPEGIQVKLTDPLFEAVSPRQATHLITARASSGKGEELMLAILEMTWVKQEEQKWHLQKVALREDLDWSTPLGASQ
ncbi:MAG TPA: hypothetical protein DEP78_11485 [Verrucomicrobiales bacterium]|nr:hypothetical protein [Verrucomicrobiales bacterium]